MNRGCRVWIFWRRVVRGKERGFWFFVGLFFKGGEENDEKKCNKDLRFRERAICKNDFKEVLICDMRYVTLSSQWNFHTNLHCFSKLVLDLNFFPDLDIDMWWWSLYSNSQVTMSQRDFKSHVQTFISFPQSSCSCCVPHLIEGCWGWTDYPNQKLEHYPWHLFSPQLSNPMRKLLLNSLTPYMSSNSIHFYLLPHPRSYPPINLLKHYYIHFLPVSALPTPYNLPRSFPHYEHSDLTKTQIWSC